MLKTESFFIFFHQCQSLIASLISKECDEFTMCPKDVQLFMKQQNGDNQTPHLTCCELQRKGPGEKTTQVVPSRSPEPHGRRHREKFICTFLQLTLMLLQTVEIWNLLDLLEPVDFHDTEKQFLSHMGDTGLGERYANAQFRLCSRSCAYFHLQKGSRKHLRSVVHPSLETVSRGARWLQIKCPWE